MLGVLPLTLSLAEQGEKLFHDPSLSASGKTSCATCHDPQRGFSDGLPGRTGRRTPPALYVVTQMQAWGWDGRHVSLEDAIIAPLLDPQEMGNDHVPDVVDALAAYLATLDHPMQHVPTRQQTEGMALFNGKACCVNCHSGPLFTDQRFHNLGLSAYAEAGQDLGRYRVTGLAQDAGRFRTPSLRHVAQSAPYMHTGHLRTLKGVVRFYAQGGGKIWARNEAEAQRPLYPEAATVSPLIRPLNLSDAEIAAIVAYLESL